jgi:hypothetical protein
LFASLSNLIPHLPAGNQLRGTDEGISSDRSGIRRRKPMQAAGMDASTVYWPSPALFPWYVAPSAAGQLMNDTGPHMHSGLAAAPRYWLRYGASHYDSITFALIPDAPSLSTTPRSLCPGPLPTGRGAQAGGAVYILSLHRYQNSLEWFQSLLDTPESSLNFDSPSDTNSLKAPKI